jgi:hypothetical protein
LAQLIGLQLLHTPRLLQPPVAQVWHASPPAPQATSVLPGRHRLPSQHPAAQLVPSQTQAPPTQRWPAWHASPAPQAQAPPAEQPLLDEVSHDTHAIPPLPHDPRDRVVQVAPAQQPSGQEVAVQAPAPSTRQTAEQPSPDAVLPSSHSSSGDRRIPSPQIAGVPRVRVALTISPRRTATACWSLPTIASPARPSTRRSTVVPASASGSSKTAVSSPLVSGRGGSGTVPAGKAG